MDSYFIRNHEPFSRQTATGSLMLLPNVLDDYYQVHESDKTIGTRHVPREFSFLLLLFKMLSVCLIRMDYVRRDSAAPR